MHANNFHLIRFLAATMVIYGHAYPLTDRGTLDFIQLMTGGLFPTAHMAVCIFFSLSGYLIANSVIHSSSYWQFIWKRFIRIMPGLVVALLFTIFVIGPIATTLPLKEYFSDSNTYLYLKNIKLFPRCPDTLPGVFTNIPFNSVNSSLWTLAYEVTCYVGIMVLYMLFKQRMKWVLLVAFLAIWGTFTYWESFLGSNPVTLRFIHLELYHLLVFSLYFMGGSLFFLFQNQVPVRGRWVIVLLSILGLVYYLSAFRGVLPLSANGMVKFILVPYAILYLGFIKGRINQFNKVGDLSYGLYIYAFPIQQLVILFALPGIIGVNLLFVLSFLLVLPLAWCSWNWVEKPSLKFKSLF